MSNITTKQQLTFSNLITAIGKGEPFDLKTLMLNAGYSEATAKNPAKNLIKKEGWQELMARIDDGVILAKFYEHLLSSDKRVSMEAGKELLKLKDKYPSTKYKEEGLGEEIRRLLF